MPCNVNYRYLADELAYLLTNADAKALFFDVTLADRVAEVRDRCPDLQLMIQVGGGELIDGAVHYDDLLAAHEPAPRIERSGDDLWFLYTGGTTGNPKAVMWPHAELQKSAEAFYRPLGQPVPTTVEAAVTAAVELHERNRTTRVLAGAPLMHGTSGIVSLRVLMTGGAVATLPSRSFGAKELWEVVAHHRLTMLAIVGEAFSRPMLEELDRAKAAGDPTISRACSKSCPQVSCGRRNPRRDSSTTRSSPCSTHSAPRRARAGKPAHQGRRRPGQDRQVRTRRHHRRDYR